MSATYPRSAFLIPLTPVTRDQELTRMCSFYALTKGLDVDAKRAGQDLEYSESYLASKVKKWIGVEGDRGATFWQIADVVKRFGVCQRADFNAGHDWTQVPGLAADLKAQISLPIEIIPLPIHGEDMVSSIKRQLVFGKVVMLTLAFGEGFRDAVNGKPWREHVLPPATSIFYMEHAMPVVGYDDDAQRFVCANSEGPNVGENGYVGLPYNQVRNTSEKVATSFWLLQTSKHAPVKVDGFMAEIATLSAQEIADARAEFKAKWIQKVAVILPENPTWQQIIDCVRQLGGTDRITEICFEMRRGDLRPIMTANNLTAPESFFEPF